MEYFLQGSHTKAGAVCLLPLLPTLSRFPQTGREGCWLSLITTKVKNMSGVSFHVGPGRLGDFSGGNGGRVSHLLNKEGH